MFVFSTFQQWGHIDPNRSGIGLNNVIALNIVKVTTILRGGLRKPPLMPKIG